MKHLSRDENLKIAKSFIKNSGEVFPKNQVKIL